MDILFYSYKFGSQNKSIMWYISQKFDKRVFNSLKINKTVFWGIFMITFFSILGFAPHPYHVSYTEINYKPEQNRLTFSVEIFTDDLENAIKLEYKPDQFFLGEKNLSLATEQIIQKYITNKISIIIDGIVIKSPHFLPSESNPDRTTIYFEYTDLPPFSSFSIYIEALNNIFKDQQHIIEFKSPQLTEKALLNIEKNNATWIIKPKN
jgi:hypothetical protein